MRNAVLIILLILCLPVFGQNSFWEKPDSIKNSRAIGVSSAVATVWAGSMIGLGQIWYKDVEKSTWHTFDDSRNWLQMDKAGHFYTAYKLNQLNTELYRWTGMNDRKALYLGTGISIGYQTTFEMFDAYSAEWGFSWADLLSNLAGSGAFLGQELLWDEERIIPKFSYHSTDYAAIRPEILGSSFSESVLKDYNGQTYWLSFSPGTFKENSRFPEWLCFSFGYSVDAKIVGDQEYFSDPITGQDYYSRRELLFSLDIDFSRIPVRKQWAKVLLKQLNYLKIPFPTLIYDGRDFQGRGIYF